MIEYLDAEAMELSRRSGTNFVKSYLPYYILSNNSSLWEMGKRTDKNIEKVLSVYMVDIHYSSKVSTGAHIVLKL